MSCHVKILGSLTVLGVILTAGGETLTQPSSNLGEDGLLLDTKADGYKFFVNFTFFEVTNADGVMFGEKPNLIERGPYVFSEEREKWHMSWYGKDENGTEDTTNGSKHFVKFGLYKKYVFQADKSCEGCTVEDEVTIANMPLLGLIGKLNRMGISGNGGMGKIKAAYEQDDQFEGMGWDGIFFKQKVIDFVFKGIKTGTAGWMLGEHGDGTQGDVLFITSRLPMTVFDHENGFALFNHRNNTMENEWYEVETEEQNWERFNVITKWGQKNHDHEFSEKNLIGDLYNAYASSLTKKGDRWWDGMADFEGNTLGNNTCNIIRGTDGHQFHPMLKQEEDLWIFNTDHCRSSFLVFAEEVEVGGIGALQYVIPPDSAHVNKTLNTCACESLSTYIKSHPYNTETSCIKREPADSDTFDLTACGEEVTMGCTDGIQDLYYCQGSATSHSQPHFYLAESQLEHFTGLQPEEEKHRTFLNVEPNTGRTLNLHDRFQVNVPLISSANLAYAQGLPFLESVPDIPHFPVLWIDMGFDV